MIALKNGQYVIGFDDGYQLGKTANFIFDNGVHRLGSVEPTLKENSLFYDGEYFKVGEGRTAIAICKRFCRVRTLPILRKSCRMLLALMKLGNFMLRILQSSPTYCLGVQQIQVKALLSGVCC